MLDSVMPHHPKISCIISTFNDADWVEKKISEIRQQTIFDQAEFIFVETDSPQKERDLIAPYTQRFSNIRLITSDKRETLYQAWNMGWDVARANLVCYSNMDDTMHPECLERVVKTMESDPTIELCSIMIAYQNDQSPGTLNSFDPKRLKHLKIASRPGPFSAWRTEIKEKMLPFDGHYKIIGDLDFWSRAADVPLRAHLIKKVLYLYTTAPSQLSKRLDKNPEREYAKNKGVTLRWHPQVANPMLLHRKIFRIFPFPYLVPEYPSKENPGNHNPSKNSTP